MKPDKKTRLVKFLDRRAFDPVLNRSRQQCKDALERKKLEHVQEILVAEKNRYHTQYESATEVRRAFFDDINSGVTNRIDDDLRELQLPSFLSLKDEFITLCENLDV